MSSSGSSSHSSLEQRPDRRYAHEHPVYTFKDYETCCILHGNGVVGQSLRNRYIHILTHEGQPQTTNSAFRLLPNTGCECWFYTQTSFCFHLLTSHGESIFPNEMRQKGPTFGTVNAQVGFLPNWHQKVKLVLEQLHYYKTSSTAVAYPVYITCPACCLVQRQTLHDGHHREIPRHKCDVGKKDRYGEDTTLRYITTFKTQDQKIIELDITCIPLHLWDFHHLIPSVAIVYQECQRLGLQTSLLQMCFQDIAFIELFGMLEHTQKVNELGVYSLYLYLEFRLIPHLQRLRVEHFQDKICPIYTIVVTDDAAVSKDLLGYDRDAVTADMCQNVPMDQQTAVDLFNRYKNVENDPFVLTEIGQPDWYLQNVIKDGLSSGRYKVEDFLTFIKILNKYRPVYEGIQMFLKRTLGDAVEDSRTFTIHCGSDERLQAFGNIFGIIPSGMFCPTGEIYGLLMLCSNHPYASWLLKERMNVSEVVTALRQDRNVNLNNLL